MAKPRSDVLQGTLSLLILKSLARGRLHGYAITAHIQRVSDDLLRVEEGSLYPALHRMEQSGWISAEWGQTDTARRARFYTLTAHGRRQLNQEVLNWRNLVNGVNAVLRFNGMSRPGPQRAAGRHSLAW